MDELRVSQEHADGTDGGVVLQIVGEIDLATVAHLKEGLATAEGELSPPGPLVINLSEVTFLASTGLSALVACHERCQKAGVDLRVVTGNPTIAHSMQITGLTQTLAVFATLEDALGSAD